MTATTTYNRAAIMREAHAAAKSCAGHPAYSGRSYASLLAGQLKRIWAEMKRRVVIALRAAQMTAADHIRHAITALEGKDRWTAADYARRDELAQAAGCV